MHFFQGGKSSAERKNEAQALAPANGIFPDEKMAAVPFTQSYYDRFVHGGYHTEHGLRVAGTGQFGSAERT